MPDPSGETAIGKYPDETIAMMSSIAMHTETAWMSGELSGPAELPPPQGIDANIAYVSHISARSLSAKVIIIYSTTGATARRVACHRPSIPVLTLSSYLVSRRRLALTWGIESVMVEPVRDTEHMIELAFSQAINYGAAVPGDIVVMATGFPYDKAAIDPMITRVHAILRNCADIRRLGSAALDICWLAMGRLDGYYESLSVWDFAAASLIAREAGAEYGHFSVVPEGIDPQFHNQDIVIANPALFPQLKALLEAADKT